jgi:hypothetical protein
MIDPGGKLTISLEARAISPMRESGRVLYLFEDYG